MLILTTHENLKHNVELFKDISHVAINKPKFINSSNFQKSHFPLCHNFLVASLHVFKKCFGKRSLIYPI